MIDDNFKLNDLFLNKVKSRFKNKYNIKLENIHIQVDAVAEVVNTPFSEEQTIDENTIDVVPENTVDENTIDVVPENTVYENTVDAVTEVVNTPASDEQTVDEETIDDIDETTVDENTIYDIPESQFVQSTISVSSEISINGDTDGQFVFFEVNQMAGPLPFDGEDTENMQKYYSRMLERMFS